MLLSFGVLLLTPLVIAEWYPTHLRSLILSGRKLRRPEHQMYGLQRTIIRWIGSIISDRSNAIFLSVLLGWHF